MPDDQPGPIAASASIKYRSNSNGIDIGTDRHSHCTVEPQNMHSAPRISVLALALAAAAFAFGGRPVMAQGVGGATGTATASPLAASDFPVIFQRYDKGSKQWVQMNDTEKTYFFNRARCECNTDTTDYSGYVRVAIQPPSTTSTKVTALLNAHQFSRGIGRLYAGSSTFNCLTPSATFALTNYCTNLIKPDDFNANFSLDVFTNARYYQTDPLPVSLFFGAASTATTQTCGSNGTCNDVSICNSSQISTVVYVWAQTSAGTSPDFTDAAVGGTLNLVGAVSVQPDTVVVEGGNDALNVSWKWPLAYSPAGDPNFLGVQLFCQRGADYQVFPGKYGNAYMTGATTCGAPDTGSYGAFSDLNPNFLCSGLLSPTTSSFRIKGLQNGITYGVGVAVVDKYYNVSPIAANAIAWGQPIPTVDFYTEYRDQGGSAPGGFCTVAGRGARPGVGTLVLMAGVALALFRRIRSKKQPPGSHGPWLLVLGAGLLLGREVQAQPLYYDGTFAEDSADEPWTGTPRHFALEARFGLYSPNVDSEIQSAVKPHSLIFGSKSRPMWQIEFDWQLFQKFGTFAVGASVGYFKENAHACTAASLQKDVGTCGGSGDNTSLRLIPFAALLIYRMDEVANRWKIPLVPYAKVGLNYTIWTITNGDGDIPDYGANGHGQGGTMGWQAALGLSLRLDFLDPGTARGFDADSGVNHSYAFFELDHINGSGLYRSDVLRVGDDTWFAGLMFEF